MINMVISLLPDCLLVFRYSRDKANMSHVINDYKVVRRLSILISHSFCDFIISVSVPSARINSVQYIS